MGSNIKYSVVIPCYNKADILPCLITRFKAAYSNVDDVEIIIVNNASTDGTESILNEHIKYKSFVRAIKLEEYIGYGHAIISGIEEARGEVVAWTAPDLRYDICDILKGFEFFKQSTNPRRLFVKGTRKGRKITENMFMMGHSLFESALFFREIWDVNSQPTIIHKSFFINWASPPFDESFDLYAYYQAHLRGRVIKRFDVKYNENYNDNEPKVAWNKVLKEKIKYIPRALESSVKLKKSVKQDLLG